MQAYAARLNRAASQGACGFEPHLMKVKVGETADIVQVASQLFGKEQSRVRFPLSAQGELAERVSVS